VKDAADASLERSLASKGSALATNREDDVSALSGDREHDQADQTAVQGEVDRLGSLDLPQFAVEVMKKIRTEGDERTSVGEIVEAFASDAFHSANEAARLRLRVLVAEALQVLEHASLVCFFWTSGPPGLYYVHTRMGRAALDAGSVERIIGGGGI
jgi:hypothetical protein